MEKLDEIRKSLIFYVNSNELKNKIVDERNNYSVADNLFGSMILATAINSEFKETNNLSKIYRMLLLSEFSILSPNYDFDNLKMGKQFVKEILESRDINNENGRLVFKYKMLDYLLTKLITESENNISKLDLIKDGSTIIASLCSKRPSECEEIFKFYYLNFRLKNKLRSGWDRKHWNIKSERIETVSEHVVGALCLAIVLNSEFGYNLDIDKGLKMLVLHETGETLIGDITPFDGITPEMKKEIEHKAMRDALGNLKDKDSLLNLLFEFDEHKTLEAKYAYYCDKIEADLQSRIYQDKGLHHSLYDQKNNVDFNSSRVQQMVKDGAKDAFDIWYEWDKDIFADDKQFPEFSNILKIARANNILYLNNVVKERIDLTDEEHLFLSQKISNIVSELYKDDNIDSVYLTNYQDSDHSKGKLNLVVLLNFVTDCHAYDNLIKELNSKIAESNKTGVNIVFHWDYVDNYSMIALNSSEVLRVEQLLESTILFDKSRHISMIKDARSGNNHLYKFYLVDYVPPVDEAIALQLTKIK